MIDEKVTGAVADWLTSLADRTVDTYTGKSGMLRVYTNRNDVPRKSYAISLDRIIEHTKLDRATICAAIGTMNPVAGTGARVHVALYTDARLASDAATRKFVSDARKENQEANWTKFMVAANRFNNELPAFNLPQEAVN